MDFEFLGTPQSLDEVCMSLKYKTAIQQRILCRRSIYIHGPPGIGKTLAVTLVAKSLEKRGRFLVHINTSLHNTVDRLKSIVGDNFSGDHFDGYEPILFFDECENLKQPSKGHRTKITKFLKLILTTNKVAVVFCANDDSEVLDIIKNKVNISLQMKPPSGAMIYRWFLGMIENKICTANEIGDILRDHDSRAKELSKTCRGDLRFFVACFVDNTDYERIPIQNDPTIQDLVRWVFAVKNRVELCRRLVEEFDKKQEYKNPRNLVVWLEENFLRVMRKSPHMLLNLELLHRAGMLTDNVEMFSCVVSSMIPHRSIRTIRFPAMFEIERSRVKRKKVTEKKTVKTVREIPKTKKTEESGGLLQWVK